MARPAKKTASATVREQILASAKRLFAERGREGVSVRDIVNDVGVNVSLVSYYFGGKDELYREFLSQFGSRNLVLARECLALPADSAEFLVRLRLYMGRMFESHIIDPDMYRIVDREIEQNRPEFHDLVQSIYVEVFRTKILFFEHARDIGICRKDTDAHVLASVVQGFLRSELRIDRIRKAMIGASLQDPTYRGKMIDLFVDVLTRGALAQGIKQ